MEDLVEVDSQYKGNIWSTPLTSTNWRLYLTEMGNDPKSHIEGVDLIRTAAEGDVIDIYLTCPGGAVDIADMYLGAIRESAAQVNTHAVGEVASAATLVFLAGDVRTCQQGSYFMFHNVQFGGMGGDSANVYARTKFYEKYFKEKFLDAYSEVLTEAEISELFERAGEVYLTGKEMTERLKVAEEKAENEENIEVGSDKLVALPFPPVKVKSAEEIDKKKPIGPPPPVPGGYVDIPRPDGSYRRLDVSTIRLEDFDCYTKNELTEIGRMFGLTIKFGFIDAMATRDDAVLKIISAIKDGN